MIDIIIINWNSGVLISNCIDSIYNSKLSKDDFRIIIVDNNSSDNSIHQILMRPNILLIENKKNIGFGAACNQAIKESDSEFILLLNPDMKVYYHSISDALRLLSGRIDIDILGIQLLDQNGKTARSCSRFPTLKRYLWDILGLSKVLPGTFTPPTIMTDWDHDESRFVDHVIGAFMLFRRSLINSVGRFDEDYFMYLEDLDFSFRVNKIGGRVFYCSSIQAFHEGGGTSKQVKAKRLFYSLSSRLVYATKYFRKSEFLILFMVTMLIEPLTRTLPLLISLKIRDVGNTFRAFSYLYKKLITKSLIP